MHWIDEIRIETPEQIDIALEAAGVGSRFLAYLLDALLKWGIVLVVGILGLVVSMLVSGEVEANTVQPMVLACLVGLIYLFLLGYDIFFEVRHNGQTPGKMLAGLRVIREAGTPVDFRSSCIRNLLGMADFLPFFYLLGSFLILLSSRNQRLGDMAAGTLVIRERQLDLPENPTEIMGQLASDDYAFTAHQLGACGVHDGHILRAFFQRYHHLAKRPRNRLAYRLAKEFLLKTAYRPAMPITRNSPEPARFLASLFRDMDNLARHDR